jgi:pimeloyl-ACP methyl ester carboxylesterase
MIPALYIALGAAGVLLALALFSRLTGRRTLALVPPSGEFLDMDGARIHYLDRGTGPVMVMIHGLGGQIGNFSYSLLDQLVDRHRVILIDRPGSGHSTAARGADASLAAQAALIVAVMDRLDVDRPLIVGHSLGGAVALALALDHPDRVRGLALIAPLANVQTAVPTVFRNLFIRSRWLRFAIANTIATPLALLFAEQGRALVFAPEAVPEDFSIKGGGLLVRRPSAFASASADIVDINEQMAAMLARYPTLRVPIEILFGREDAILDPALNGEAAAALLPNARLTLSEGGHMLPITQPALVRDWLERFDEHIRATATERGT